LAAAKAEQGQVVVPGGSYRAVVVPACEHLSLATFERLLDLAKSGGTAIFQDRLPPDVPGWGHLAERREKLRQLLASLQFADASAGKIRIAKIGRGRIVAGDMETALTLAGAAREPMADLPGLRFIRRKFAGGVTYFVVNEGKSPLDAWVPLAGSGKAAALFDPLSGQTGMAAARKNSAGLMEIYLQLEPGASLILRTFAEKPMNAPDWPYRQPAGQPVELGGEWRIEFIAGGPELPPALKTKRLASWTELGGKAAQRFAGTARYSLHFDAPAGAADHWLLDLDAVCQSARVRLNGRDCGVLFAPPYRIAVDRVQPRDNLLEIEVTNVSANRIRDLDRRGAVWKNFHDINFVNIKYKPFDASNWPLHPAGLLGPVSLQAVKRVSP
jgi:hypothetical protein